MGKGLAAIGNWPASKRLTIVPPESRQVKRHPDHTYKGGTYPRLVAAMMIKMVRELTGQANIYGAEVVGDVLLALLGDPSAVTRNLERMTGLMKGNVKFLRERGAQSRPPREIGGWIIGQNLAPTKNQVVYKSPVLELRYFPRKTGSIPREPLLWVFSWINGALIADLQDGKSMVQTLTENGHDVFVTDWKGVDVNNSELAIFDRYVQQILLSTLIIQALSGAAKIDLAGYCVGGVISDVAAARLPQLYDRLINLAAGLTVRVGNEGGGLIYALTEQVDMSAVNRLYGGVIPGSVFADFFNFILPERDAAISHQYTADFWVNFVRGAGAEKVHPLIAWNILTSRGVGKAHVTFINHIIKRDELARGEFECLGKRINLGDIEHPFLSLLSSTDHIVHPDSVLALSGLIGTPLEDQIFIVSSVGGHLGAMTHPDVYEYMAHFLAMARVERECGGEANLQIFGPEQLRAAIKSAQEKLASLLGENMLPHLPASFNPTMTSWGA